MEPILIAVTVFFAVFTQAVSGFGLALVSMPILLALLDPTAAASLVALMALTMQLMMVSRYRKVMRIGALWRLMLGSLLGIPLGVLSLTALDERLILTALGILLIAYSAYALLNFQLPALQSASPLAYGFGFVSGLLHGAYNTGGPPYVVFGMCCNWQPDEFKGNVQALLMVNSSSVIVAHIIAGHFNASVMQTFALALPMIAIGAFAGFKLDDRLDAARFRKVILVLLLVVGIKLVLPA